jgi:ATP-dependent DNA helicase RecG
VTNDKLKTTLAIGETVAVEFKRCGNGISADTYETVCSFLNRFGGDIYLGVEDNGKVCGVPKKAAPDLVKNFINMVSNPDVINPTVYLTPEIVEYEGKQIIHIHIPPSSEVHSCKKVVYDRNGDSDVKVTATGQIAQLYIRKHKIFTEKTVYPYVKDEDLRFDLIPRLRQRAINRYQEHPWKTMTDSEILQSTALIGEDPETGKTGYNLAAVMLLGRDDVIFSISPTYRTDALLRKVNVDRYDDRVIVQTNLIESYDILMQFAEKHLWDKFYLEGDVNVSLRSVISREMLVNTLMHREFTSTYFAKFVVEKNRMYIENANRATTGGVITPENLAPDSKNPIIAAFFRNIGLSDELGSGVRKLHYYVPRYSGKPPELIDGDIFRIIVPLDDTYSFEAGVKAQLKGKNCTLNCTLNEKAILEYLSENPTATQTAIAAAVSKSVRTVKSDMGVLQEKGLLKREGAKKNGSWIIKLTDDK